MHFQTLASEPLSLIYPGGFSCHFGKEFVNVFSAEFTPCNLLSSVLRIFSRLSIPCFRPFSHLLLRTLLPHSPSVPSPSSSPPGTLLATLPLSLVSPSASLLCTRSGRVNLPSLIWLILISLGPLSPFRETWKRRGLAPLSWH